MVTRDIRETGITLYLSAVGLFVTGGFALGGLMGAAAGAAVGMVLIAALYNSS